MERRLELLFENAVGRQTIVTVQEPKDDVTNGEIQSVMDLIVDKNLFNSTGGDLVKAVGARLISKDVEELFKL